MPSPAVISVLFGALAALAAAASRPASCLGGVDRLTICLETPSIQPRRYDNGGLYGAEYFRRRHGAGRGVIAPQPDYAVHYDYGLQSRPAYGRARPVYYPQQPAIRPAPPVYRTAPPMYRPAPPMYRPAPPMYRPAPPVFRPSRPIPVDYGLERRSGYAQPSVYGGSAGYVGGFQPVVAPRPYQRQYPAMAQPLPDRAQHRPFIIRPHVSGPQFPPHPDIRSFYQGASMLGRGRISADDRNNVQFVCDFAQAGLSPTTDVLTDVVWQKVGRPAYMNNPMTSASTYPNLLSCPNTYVNRTPTNYGFNIGGSKTTLVIKNATSADYGVYRCYATRVSRQNPRQRTPVYMEVYYSRTGTAGRR